MFNTTTIAKVGGSLLGSLLVVLLINWVAGAIYSTGAGQGTETVAQETTTESPPADGGAATDTAAASNGAATDTAAAGNGAAADQTASAAMATGDAAKGAKVFSKCKACHKIQEGVNAVGPSLFGIVGRKIASTNYKYSPALSGTSGDWTKEKLDAFLAGPKAFAPGTKMTFKGLKKDTDRADVIAYLETLGG